MKIMIIDVGYDNKTVEIKDTEKKISYHKIFDIDDKISYKRFYKYVIAQAEKYRVDEIHVDSFGVSEVFYDYIINNASDDIKNKTIQFKHVDM